MILNITAVTDETTQAAVSYIRAEVFRREWQVTFPNLETLDPSQSLTLLATELETNEPIATLSVVETTRNHSLHNLYGLSFEDSARVARYTQMAVLKKFRGTNTPVRLILEARRRFIIPRRFAYTWLLFDAERAKSSALCNLLGFKASSHTIVTEYARNRVLTRSERAADVDRLDRRAFEYLSDIESNPFAGTNGHAGLLYPAKLQENEWLAH
jgi:hypothetical protein